MLPSQKAEIQSHPESCSHLRKLKFKATQKQSVTSRLETSRYRDFSQFFESIGLGLENFGLENIWSRKKVSVSVSKIFSLEKKSRYWSQKYLVSKKVSVLVSKTLVSKKVSVSVSEFLVSKKVSVTT